MVNPSDESMISRGSDPLGETETETARGDSEPSQTNKQTAINFAGVSRSTGVFPLLININCNLNV